MSHMGLLLIWSSIQITIPLLLGVALHALASRRSHASGAWVSAVSLGIAVVVGLVSIGRDCLVPGPNASHSTRSPAALSSVENTLVRDVASSAPAKSTSTADEGIELSTLRRALGRLTKPPTLPVEYRVRWGEPLAVACLFGVIWGLIRLALGLRAVHILIHRSSTVSDPELDRLRSELQATMNCRRRVEVRESAELSTPATAGWFRHVILLPIDWRSWDDDERRAVLAHELAHICRADYFGGVIAQVAVSLYFFHPLVHWLVSRLQLQQELAADALGARFAGGNSQYLRSLSRLALQQDGRLPFWPARAFLTARGSLIRRITMLREESKSIERPWSGNRRTLAAALLMTIGIGALLVQRPTFAEDAAGSTEAGSTTSEKKSQDGGTEKPLEPFDVSYVTDDNEQGFVAFRPAAAFRRSGMKAQQTIINAAIAKEWMKAASELKFDPTKPGLKPLRIEMFDQITTKFRVWRVEGKKPNGRYSMGELVTIRTTQPVDWVALLRAFKLETVMVRDGDRVYYRINSPRFGPHGSFFYPDDRTVVFDQEEKLLKILHRTSPPPAPVFAKGKDWDQSLRGLVLVGVDNRGGRISKPIRGDDPADKVSAEAASFFENLEQWTFRIDDDDQTAIRGTGTCSDNSKCELAARTLGGLIASARKEIDKALEPKEIVQAKADPNRPDMEKAMRWTQSFLKGLQVERNGNSLQLSSTPFGTLADLTALIVSGELGL